MKSIVKIFLLFLLLTGWGSCARDNEIYAPEDPTPQIVFIGNEERILVIKIGNELVVTPEVRNEAGAVFSWNLDSRTIGTEKTLRYAFEETGEYFLLFRIISKNGSDEAELKVTVTEKAVPMISFALADDTKDVVAGKSYLFEPEIVNGEEAVFLWTLDGEPVGDQPTYSFLQQELGTYQLKLTVENEDGKAEKEITVHVMDRIPLTAVAVPGSRYYGDPTVKSVYTGRTLHLRPMVENAENPSYSWYVQGPADNEPVLQSGETSRMFAFNPTSEGTYRVTFRVTDHIPQNASQVARNIRTTGEEIASLTYTVTCYGEEKTGRPVTGNPAWDKVYEFVPAPGQFINETVQGGFSGESTHQQAVAYAEKRMSETKYVSLGAFGGYIVVGFDHSIENKGGYQGYDFSITGNAFTNSSEPGIVWVSQDVNGNGLPDDEWYELRGSETGKETTWQEYAVTYYRPSGKQMKVRWTDNRGNAGSVDWNSYHTQDTYYPLWIASDSYTLYGTRLQDRTVLNPRTGFYENQDYPWGYADNFGEDRLSPEENAQAGPLKNFFKISNAIDPEGNPVNLGFIDFIKVQTGVNGKAGWLGEVSTEVFGFADENLTSNQ